MESTECTFDELLCQCLLMFRQFRFYDNSQESEVEAYKMLEEAKLLINKTHDCVDMAKWGCIFECLAQKYYITGDTDGVLEEIDIALVSFWKKIKTSQVEAFTVYLWLGYYFLLRFRNGMSRSHGRCKRVMSDILSYLTKSFRQAKKELVPMDEFSFFSIDVWGETVYWVELVYGSCFCEKQSAALLRLLYDLRQTELPPNKVKQDVLLQQILEFYSF